MSHHKDRNVHRVGFRFPSPELPPKHTFNAVPLVRIIVFALVTMFVLGMCHIHP